MTSGLYDSIARIARHEVAARTQAAVGVVQDLFPSAGGATDHAISVTLRDSGLDLPRVPLAVGALGFASLPAVGELVVIVFLDGDVNAPIVVGRLYDSELSPPQHAPEQLVLALPPGESEPELRLVVDGGAPSATLTLPGGVELCVQSEQVKVTVGEVSVLLSAQGGGRAELTAGGSSIVVKQDGDVTIQAAGKLTLEAAEVEIKGSGKVAIKGAQVDLN